MHFRASFMPLHILINVLLTKATWLHYLIQLHAVDLDVGKSK